MSHGKTFFVGAFVVCAASIVRADVESGPKVGDAVASLSVQTVTNGQAAEAADLAAQRGEQPTIYVFLPAGRFDRPAGRFIKSLDTAMQKRQMLHPTLQVVLVWMVDDATAGAARVSAIQGSLQLSASQWTVWKNGTMSPEGWAINDRASVTAVVVGGKTVKATFGFDSINDTVVPMVDAAVAKIAP